MSNVIFKCVRVFYILDYEIDYE